MYLCVCIYLYYIYITIYLFTYMFLCVFMHLFSFGLIPYITLSSLRSPSMMVPCSTRPLSGQQRGGCHILHQQFRMVFTLSGWWWLEHDCYFSIQLGFSWSHLTHIFQRGRYTTNQLYILWFYASTGDLDVASTEHLAEIVRFWVDCLGPWS